MRGTPNTPFSVEGRRGGREGEEEGGRMGEGEEDWGREGEGKEEAGGNEWSENEEGTEGRGKKVNHKPQTTCIYIVYI